VLQFKEMKALCN